jgi:hypothetical protein
MVRAAAILGAKIRAGGVTANDIAQFRLCLSELGMTPTASSKVRASVPEDGKPQSLDAI